MVWMHVLVLDKSMFITVITSLRQANKTVMKMMAQALEASAFLDLITTLLLEVRMVAIIVLHTIFQRVLTRAYYQPH